MGIRYRNVVPYEWIDDPSQRLVVDPSFDHGTPIAPCAPCAPGTTNRNAASGLEKVPRPPAPLFPSGGIDRNPSIDFEPTWVKGFGFLKALEALKHREESHEISNGGPK